MKRCFISMPLVEQLLDVYGVIEKEVRDILGAQWKCSRADDTRSPGLSMDRIVSALLNTDLVIAVVADPREGNTINPNVMYELGIAHSFRKSSVIVADVNSDLPFNIRPLEVAQVDFSSPGLLSALREELQRALRSRELHDELEGRRKPCNPITSQLGGAPVFVEDLPWLWGYCEVFKRERAAATVWEITRDLYWPGEKSFFRNITESVRAGRRHYYMVENDERVLLKMKQIKHQLELEVPRAEIDRAVHFVAIDRQYFVLWPIAVVLYDADLATRSGGIICEPMQSQVGGDKFDQLVKKLLVEHGTTDCLDDFQRRLFELSWTERHQESSFDISLDGRIVDELATSFTRIWNEKILEEAQDKSGDEKAALLNTWLIGG